MAQLFAGTSGFSYPAWKPDFYPKDLPAKRFLEHYASRLNSVEVNYTFRQLPSAETLEGWLGPVLFQLGPAFKCDLSLLGSYLDLLPRDMRFAFEFRHASWLADPVYELLGKHNVALCLAESEKLEVPKVFTADFGYFRLRRGDYSEEARLEVAGQARRLLTEGRDAYVYFKHEDDPHGALWAEELIRACG